MEVDEDFNFGRVDESETERRLLLPDFLSVDKEIFFFLKKK